MINMQFDMEAFREEFREIIREEMREAITDGEGKTIPTVKIVELPAMLTREELKQFLNIGSTKAAELLARADFPVLREAGILIPTHLLMQWIEANTQWIHKNAKSFTAIS